MKRASNIRSRISQAANRISSKWTARSTAAQSFQELKERGRVAVAEAVIAVEDTRVLIGETSVLAARFKAAHNASALAG